MEESPQIPLQVPVHVGIAYSTPIEIAPFFARCRELRKITGGRFPLHVGLLKDASIAFVECGMGGARARRAVQTLMDGHNPNWVVTTGFAGSLASELKRGDMIVADELVDGGDRCLKIDVRMPSDPAHGLHVGRVLTLDRIVRTAAEKIELGRTHRALAVDMESLDVAEVCRDTGTKCMSVRVISDNCDEDLPPEVLTIVGSTGSVRLGAAVAAIWKRPSSLQDLWKLRENANHAARRLASFLDGVVQQLSAATPDSISPKPG